MTPEIEPQVFVLPSNEGRCTADLVGYLHSQRENERISLARQLHDDLGGLLVSAAMDLDTVEHDLTAADDVRNRLRRVTASLSSAIDLKRSMTESLRPSLLDNFGLFATLRWYLKHSCNRANAECTENYPESELALTPVALSNLFRSAQTLLEITFSEGDLTTVGLQVTTTPADLLIRIGHEHAGSESVDVRTCFSRQLASVVYRINALRGRLSIQRLEHGTVFELQAGLDGVLAQTDSVQQTSQVPGACPFTSTATD
jgi:signal transduction histidine kinase